MFQDYAYISPVKVKGFSESQTTEAIGKGTVIVKGWSGDKFEFYKLTNCLHIPHARVNLISQSQLDKHGVEAKFMDGKVYLTREHQTIIDGHLHNKMYHLRMEPIIHNSEELHPLVLMAEESGGLPGFYTA